MLIKVNDRVEIIAGEYRSRPAKGADKVVQGKVLKVLPSAGKVIVEGVNKMYKHVKPSQRNPQGGRLLREAPIQMSNVMYVCNACGQRSRLGVKILDSGVKVRVCKKCNADQGEIAPARKSK
ncbi:50S ribosomal protein L24 [Blastopirellula marina]|uniref:Large ribosomal subunit protein uL24 n=1 Tax=Blastopirellula marina TaxID=124 RepID=A0A2S8FTP0_9BACT|nr:50S ribosomal protein L24 [Blastopirellula marina]PQO35537.1 50S ribosomal protein L24 [Blastopirellula marina]PQO48046.1 50S ribosomal protein L24 [Blastopirellula marina]PTL44176.1 50S ribosomal protein L24 [Blastopirellula marina]